MGNGMSQVLPGLFLGSFADAKDVAQLSKNKITHIISIHDTPQTLLQGITYLRIPLPDAPEVPIKQHFQECIDFIHGCRLAGGNCLVHCMAGVSRSATIVTAYIMGGVGLGWEEALAAVRGVRPSGRPQPRLPGNSCGTSAGDPPARSASSYSSGLGRAPWTTWGTVSAGRPSKSRGARAPRPPWRRARGEPAPPDPDPPSSCVSWRSASSSPGLVAAVAVRLRPCVCGRQPHPWILSCSRLLPQVTGQQLLRPDPALPHKPKRKSQRNGTP
ncbi:dual specificity protein phosphatase 15 isoform X2 [Ornithorhynchus anatinus]|uniref:dual specificity protein phosphatase 15 isoform X2 n=1 Tax=Ornithorhynchus anatinus TaxID=9258 RepID=UPI0010A8B5BC|nr:dual specificity protein phosphatase 15 isoform X2 [Ornithorhynchus anatinus]